MPSKLQLLPEYIAKDEPKIYMDNQVSSVQAIQNISYFYFCELLTEIMIFPPEGFKRTSEITMTACFCLINSSILDKSKLSYPKIEDFGKY